MLVTNTAQLNWQDYSGHGHLEANDSEGSWKVGPVVDGCSAPIGFQLHGWTDDNYHELRAAIDSAEEGSREKARLRNIMAAGIREQGLAATQDDAKAAIEVRRTGDISLSHEEALRAAGFEFAHSTDDPNGFRFYRRKSPNGGFSLAVSKTSVHLRHDRRGSRFSDLLFTLSSEKPTYDRKGTVWFFWPERVEQHFLSLAIQAAARVADDYVASGRNRARRRRAA
jgi:hypothetical protein